LSGKKRLRGLRDPLTIIGFIFLVGLVLFALIGPSIPNGTKDPVLDPLTIGVHQPWGSEGAPLGTDATGRSIMHRLAYGARISLLIGLVVQIVNLVVGVSVGVIGTFAPRWIANPVMRFTDGMFAFPDLLLALLIIGIMGAGMPAVIVALTVAGWPGMARLSRSVLTSLKEREYVVAARAAGASTFYVVTRHMLPQMMGMLLAVTTLELSATILAESTLGFLGIGVQPPTPTWGDLANQARTHMESHPQELIAPCLIMVLTITALNFVGDGLRAHFDPRTE
jgi:ABC-type dipeptide/oligopeptide/nickel transport system permease subunit